MNMAGTHFYTKSKVLDIIRNIAYFELSVHHSLDHQSLKFTAPIRQQNDVARLDANLPCSSGRDSELDDSRCTVKCTFHLGLKNERVRNRRTAVHLVGWIQFKEKMEKRKPKDKIKTQLVDNKVKIV